MIMETPTAAQVTTMEIATAVQATTMETPTAVRATTMEIVTAVQVTIMEIAIVVQVMDTTMVALVALVALDLANTSMTTRMKKIATTPGTLDPAISTQATVHHTSTEKEMCEVK